MKKIGIVGGVGWRSTVDYYSEICRRSEEWQLSRDPQVAPSTPEISIESLDLNKAFSCLGSDDRDESWRQFDDYHRAALRRLEASGAEVALIAANTPHHRFAEIVRGIGIPVINIFEAVAKVSAGIDAKQVLILGTALTMKSPVFRQAFARHGIRAAGPHDETASMTVELITELQLGKLDGAAERLGKIVAIEVERQGGGQPVVCLACTELPLAFQQQQKMLATFEQDGVLYINSTAVHIDAVFDFAVAER